MLVKFVRRSPISGKTRERVFEVTPEGYAAFLRGEYIQKALPHLSAADREFIISGCTEEEFDRAFPEED